MKLYYAVVHIASAAVLYCGSSLRKMAKRLRRGTVYGKAMEKSEAVWMAQRWAWHFRKKSWA
jgi:hypothetical protein